MKWVQLIPAALFLVVTQSSAITGNKYRELSEPLRQAWVVGAVDGILTEQLMTTNKRPPWVDCLDKLTFEQLRAMLDKELDGKPETWHFAATFNLYSVIKRTCN